MTSLGAASWVVGGLSRVLAKVPLRGPVVRWAVAAESAWWALSPGVRRLVVFLPLLPLETLGKHAVLYAAKVDVGSNPT